MTRRLRVGEESPPVESPCLGCGAYYFQEHAPGCDYEQCARCGSPITRCECEGDDE
jgi:rRNA maturation endonuclease Nob1